MREGPGLELRAFAMRDSSVGLAGGVAALHRLQFLLQRHAHLTRGGDILCASQAQRATAQAVSISCIAVVLSSIESPPAQVWSQSFLPFLLLGLPSPCFPPFPSPPFPLSSLLFLPLSSDFFAFPARPCNCYDIPCVSWTLRITVGPLDRTLACACVI